MADRDKRERIAKGVVGLSEWVESLDEFPPSSFAIALRLARFVQPDDEEGVLLSVAGLTHIFVHRLTEMAEKGGYDALAVKFPVELLPIPDGEDTVAQMNRLFDEAVNAELSNDLGETSVAVYQMVKLAASRDSYAMPLIVSMHRWWLLTKGNVEYKMDTHEDTA